MAGKPHSWAYKCLLCGAVPANVVRVDQYQREMHGNLVAMQHHAMLHHSIGHMDLEKSERVPPHGEGDNHRKYIWKLPDGRPWLEAKRILHDPVPMTAGPKTGADYVREQRR